VIGAGSSGIQIVPSIQPHVQHIDHYVRGKTWIAPSFGSKFVEERNNGVDGNFAYTDKEIEEFKSNPAEYMKYRRSLEEDMQGIFSLTHRGSLAQRAARDHFETLMKMRLSANPDLMEYMIPSSAPCCRRLTPGPGYLEALGAENVTMISTRIEKITPTGVITSDNIHREVDAIMCATGFDASFLSRFRIQGLGGVSLAERWTKSQKHSSYLSITTNDFPNFFMCLGPNSGVGNGSLVIMLESYVAYAAQCLAKLQTENIRTIAPKQEVVQAFTSFCHAYFERTVFSEDCSSWYKTSYPSLSSGQLAPAADKAENGNVTSEACSDTPELHVRVTALWPGSSLHAVKALAKPRWEDFEYTYMDGNNLGWLGDGWTEGDRAAERGFVVGNPDLSYYLKEGFLDGKT
jgi:cation diffusion facilitator CzcD-associated flavoprotein CzcO